MKGYMDMSLKVYVMPDGSKWQFNEGEQPESAVIYEPEKPKATTRRTTATKKKADK